MPKGQKAEGKRAQAKSPKTRPGFFGRHRWASRSVSGMVKLKAKSKSIAARSPLICRAKKAKSKKRKMVCAKPNLSAR